MILKWILILVVIITVNYSSAADLPTLYEYYTSGGIKSGLKADSNQFVLNGKEITLLSGSLHYFRVPQELWKDRLLKYKAAGLNAVQFYSPWNLHEETPGHWDFETGFLNLDAFLKAIKDADMFAVYRPGPYICAEWEMGGFPAWLLRDSSMKLRSNYKPYLEAVGKYYNKVLEIANNHTFSVNGGPIIAFQLENEYGGINNANDNEYLNYLKDTVTKSGFKELLFTSDPGSKARTNPIKNFTGVLETANLNSDALAILTDLRKNQPNKPLYVSEFWPGWFDAWGETHHTMTLAHFEQQVSDILFKANSSINFYMFFGGTNFGFMNGGHVITSYDYNAPLSESGNYTDKYYKTKELFEKFRKERGEPMVLTPDMPKVENPAHYGVVKITEYLPYNDLLSKVKAITSEKPKQMEYLDVGTNYGQNFGFTLYRATVAKMSKLTIKGGVSDRGVIAIDNHEVATVEQTTDYNLNTTSAMFTATGNDHTLDILVENTGRVNGGNMNNARKGLSGDVLADDKAHTGWQIYPLDFKQSFVESLSSLKWLAYENIKSPAVFRAELDVTATPKDTFLKLDNWTKGNAFVNGFNIGRYYNKGPQKTLYVPSSLLKTGKNDIYLFELHSSGGSVEFVDKPILG